MGDKALDPISTLSRGFRQRVGVAQAILHKPRFLILDEPTNGLDPGQTQDMRQLVRDLAQSATIILSTHIMQEVNAICDRALIPAQRRLGARRAAQGPAAGQRLRLRTDAAAPVASLVSGAASLGEGAWLLEVDGDLDLAADQAAKALLGANAPIYELAPQQRDLETLFREVSEGASS